MKSTIFYRGPSQIDGSPIIGILSGLRGTSGNIKTGSMIQTWILRSDIPPVAAVDQGKDTAICGDCRMRHNLNGSCYVLPFQAPSSLFHAAQAGRLFELSDLKPGQLRRFNHAFKRFPVRLGAYGDPAAISPGGWEPILSRARTWTGYTHQWFNSANQWLQSWCCASVESLEEKKLAGELGWRTSRTSLDGSPERDETRCLNQLDEMILCEDCLLCDGSKKNIVGYVHGSRKVRFN